MTPPQLCDFLNDHVMQTMPGFRIEFLPAAQQPTAVVAYIKFKERIAFDVAEEAKRGKPGMECLFKERVNDALSQIAERALDSKID